MSIWIQWCLRHKIEHSSTPYIILRYMKNIQLCSLFYIQILQPCMYFSNFGSAHKKWTKNHLMFISKFHLTLFPENEVYRTFFVSLISRLFTSFRYSEIISEINIARRTMHARCARHVVCLKMHHIRPTQIEFHSLP